MYRRFLTDEPEGFPLELDKFLKWQQESYTKPIDALAAMVGNMGVISGLSPAGAGDVSNGWIFLNGEIIFFEGGTIDEHFYVTETKEILIYQGGIPKEVLITKKCVFGVSAVQYAYADLKRPGTLISLVMRMELCEKMLRPLVGYQVADPDNPGSQITVHGSWLFWGRPASEIPDGWAAVDDEEWKGRVPVVLDTGQDEFNLVGKIGGSKTHTLTIDELPSNEVPIPNSSVQGQSDNANDRDVMIPAPQQYINVGGNDEPHPNLQPYKVVMFIKFVG